MQDLCEQVTAWRADNSGAKTVIREEIAGKIGIGVKGPRWLG